MNDFTYLIMMVIKNDLYSGNFARITSLPLSRTNSNIQILEISFFSKEQENRYIFLGSKWENELENYKTLQSIFTWFHR